MNIVLGQHVNAETPASGARSVHTCMLVDRLLRDDALRLSLVELTVGGQCRHGFTFSATQLSVAQTKSTVVRMVHPSFCLADGC